MTLAMFALAYLAVLRSHLQAQEEGLPATTSPRAIPRPGSRAQKAQVVKRGRISNRPT
jgi:hypothetical protein